MTDRDDEYCNQWNLARREVLDDVARDALNEIRGGAMRWLR